MDIKKLKKDVWMAINQAFDLGSGHPDGKNLQQLKEDCEAIVDKASDDGYSRGLNDTWHCVKMIYQKLATQEVAEVFGTAGICEILNTLTPEEAVLKLKAWEAKKEEEKAREEAKVHLFDEIIDVFGRKAVVTSIDDEGSLGIFYHGLTSSFKEVSGTIDTAKKTGRSFPQLKELVEQMN